MKIEFDIFNREFFRTLTFSLKFQKKAQVSIIYMKNIVFLLPVTLDYLCQRPFYKILVKFRNSKKMYLKLF
jgi:hypothetical protein